MGLVGDFWKADREEVTINVSEGPEDLDFINPAEQELLPISNFSGQWTRVDC